MFRKTLLTPALIVSALMPALVGAAPAVASPSQVISDCNSNGHLTGHYSRKDLQAALNGMGADVKEYTNCYDVIRRALDASAVNAAHGGGGGGAGGIGGGGGGGYSGGGSADTGPTLDTGGSVPGVSTRGVYGIAQNAVGAGRGSAGPVKLDGGTPVAPGANPVNASSGASHSLPLGLIIVLILLGLVALSGGGFAVRHRVGPGFSGGFAGLRRVLSRGGG